MERNTDEQQLDIFAGHALAGLLASASNIAQKPQDIAKEAYRHAAAMMVARKNRLDKKIDPTIIEDAHS